MQKKTSFIPEGTPAHIQAIVSAAIQCNQIVGHHITDSLEEMYLGYISSVVANIEDPDERYQIYKTKQEAIALLNIINTNIQVFEFQNETIVFP